MSEVDRLSTSGTYPALALTGKRRQRGEAREEEGRERRDGTGEARTSAPPAGTPPPARNSNSLIDEYA